MPAGFFLTIISALFLVGLSFTPNISADSSPRTFNEKFVIGALQKTHSAQSTFQDSVGNGNYGTFEQLRNENFIDGALATGEKYFYHFTITIVNAAPDRASQYQVSAVPQRYGKSGKLSFFIDESGVVRGADRSGEPATVDYPPIPINCGERGAILSMRWLQGAEETFKATVGNENYGTLAQLAQAGLIDEYLATGEKCGYSFRIEIILRSNETQAGFMVRAVPSQYGVTGFRSFYMDESGVIRGADRGGAEANRDDPPIKLKTNN